MRITTLIALGTLTIFAGCEKAKEPGTTDVPAAPSGQSAPVPAAPVAQAPTRLPAPEVPPAPSSGPQPPSYAADDQAVPQHPVYTDYRPPLAQPQPIAVPWAPPPLLDEAIPPQPSPDAFWTGGYWVWRGQWEWAPGHWARPPRPDYRWVPPYYEHRNDRVLFIDGFWSAPGVAFVRPAATLTIALAVIGAGVAIGRPPVGPDGPFVPPPPGSRWGLIVPAPVGTSPSVVRGAPPIIAPGMRVTNNVTRVTNNVRNTTIDSHNTTVVNNFIVEAPASATANHQAVHAAVAPQAHLVAGPPAVTTRPTVHAAPPPPGHAGDRTIAPPEATRPNQRERAAPTPKPSPPPAHETTERKNASAAPRPPAPTVAPKPEAPRPPPPHEARAEATPHPQPHAAAPVKAAAPKEHAVAHERAKPNPKAQEKDREREK